MEVLEHRRHLSGSNNEVPGGHLVGCPCGVCSGGADGFVDQPLTAAEKRALHGDDLLSARFIARKHRPALSPAPPPGVQSGGAETTPGAAVGQRPTGALSSRIIFAAAGHGFTAANTGSGNFSTQRGNTNSMVEDLGNFDQMTQFVQYAWNAGATIVPTRPVGFQPNEIVLDNTSAGVTFSGPWSAGGAGTTGTVTFFSLTGSNPSMRYREATASAAETATARYTPNITQAGFYPVYAWASNSSAYVANNLPDQLYRITHTGGKTEVRVDHRKVGKGWVYLGTYYFDAGTAGYLEVSNKSAFGGKAIADAVRFGNGMGDIDRGSGISGQSREDEASLYWIQKQADFTYQSINGGAPALIPASTYRGSNSTDDNANVGAPPRWSAYMNNSAVGSMTDRLFLSYHSNASGGTARGTIGLYNGNNTPSTKTPFQFEWALYAAREVNDDLVDLSGQLEFPWFDHTTSGSLTLDRSDIEFGEINNSYIANEFDATILEVAYHDNATDAALMRDPRVRQWVGRSSVQAAVRYFNDPVIGGGGALNFAPDAPTNVRAVTQPNGDVILSWAAPVPAPGTGEAATGYVIESSSNGYGFDGGIVVPGGATLSYTIPAAQLDPAVPTYFRLVSTNAGGFSVPSVVVGTKRNPAGAAQILVVNGFDRLQRTQDPKQTAPISGPGTSSTFDRVRPRYSNSFDYVVQAGQAIGAFSNPDIGFDSAQNESVVNGQVNLSSYAAVIWLSGEESTADDTFNATEQALVTAYVNGGGKFFASGAEIGWDLVAQGGGASFFNNTLHAGYVSDDAGVYGVIGAAGSIFAGLSFSFDNGSQFYDVDFADVLSASAGSTVAMTYSGGSSGAATQWAGGSGQKVVTMGFPFETITTAANRNAVMSAVLNYFGFVPSTPAPGVPDLASISDAGFSDADNLTNRNNSSAGTALDFVVPGTIAGATVTIYSDGVAIGSVVATGSATTVTSNGTTALADGSRQITATQQLSGQPVSVPSAALSISIETVAPTISAPTFFFSTIHGVTLQFSENVGPTLLASDFDLDGLTGPTQIPSADLQLGYSGSDLAVLTFPGQPSQRLPSDRYRLTLPSGSMTDAAGNTLAADFMFDFFFLDGDANHDAAVNSDDFNILAGSFGQSGDFTDGDFNYDGIVNSDDFNILAGRFGQILPGVSGSRQNAPPVSRVFDEVFSTGAIV